jgi:hypothetical protein
MEALPLLHLGGLKPYAEYKRSILADSGLTWKKWNGLKRLKGQKGLYRRQLMFTNRSRSLP